MRLMILLYVRDKQHLVNLLAMGRLYIAEHEVQEALAPSAERTKNGP